MIKQRASGVLLHPTSLPGPYGIGDLGPEAYKWIDFLADTGTKILANITTWTHRIWRFTLSMFFGLCG